jgi:hypothetical protein
MSNIFITDIIGQNDFAVPDTDAKLATATVELDALLTTVAGLVYDRALAWVETQAGAGAFRTLNCLIEKFYYNGEECPDATEVVTMTAAIKAKLEGDADITSIADQQVHIFQAGAYHLWQRDAAGGFLYPNTITDDVAVGGHVAPTGKWFDDGDLVLGGNTMVGTEKLLVIGSQLIDQNGNGYGLDIDSEATGQPLINLQSILANTRGDVAFGTARTADPGAPLEGDLWYESTDNRFRYRDGTYDLTLWPQPYTTVIVSPRGGDFTSIKDAIDSIADASLSKPYAVVVYPGVYAEDPMALKQYVAVTGIANTPAIIQANNNASPLITFAAHTTLENFTIYGPTGDASCYIAGGITGISIEDIIFVSGQTAVLCTGAGSEALVEQCKTLPGITNGLLAQSSGRIDCSNILQYATNAFYADGGTIWVHNSGGLGCTNGLYANNGGIIYPHNVTLESCTYGVRTGSTGTNFVEGNTVASRTAVTYGVYQEATGSKIWLTGSRFDLDKIRAANWADIEITFDSNVEGSDQAIATMSFSVGVPEYGQETHLGRGAEYTRGMTVLTTDNTATNTTDGGNFIDVSAAAASPSGSTFSFQGTGANHTILISSSLSDGSDVLKHWGLWIKQTTAAVEITKRSFLFEIWDGAQWADVTVLAVKDPQLYRYANEVFIRGNDDEYVKYGIEQATTWAKKTINGLNRYWSRIRIMNALTTAPIFEQFKLMPSHLHVEIDGTLTFAGLARYRSTLSAAGNAFGESGGVVDTTMAVGSGGIPTGWSHNIKSSLLNQNDDAIMYQYVLPRGIDTGQPVYLYLTLVPVNGTAGTVTMIGSFLPAEVAFVLEADPTGGTTPVPRTVANTETVVAKAAQTSTKTFTSGSTTKQQQLVFGPFDVSNYYEGDTAYIRIELDDDGAGNADVLAIALELSGVMWTLGKRLAG